MEKWVIVLLLVVGVAMAVGSVLLRNHDGTKYQINAVDLALIVVPLLLVGLGTGKLKELGLFGVSADLSGLFGELGDTHIDAQVNRIAPSSATEAVEMMEPAMKGGVSDIPRLIEQKTEALAFKLGMGGYYGPAIRKYFEDLYGSSYLRFVVLDNPDGTLYGMYNAADVIAYLRTLDDAGYGKFEEMLNRGDATAKKWLSQLPGFVSAAQAVTPEMTKRDALQAMEDRKLDSLPVVGPDRRFVGTVERSKLTSSLILAATRGPAGEQAAGPK